MIKIIYRIIATAFLLAGIFAPVLPVHAANIDLPDVQTIDSIEVYRHACDELNSQLWLMRYNCDYTTNTTTYDIDEAYLFILKESATNATISVNTAYAYYDSGYGRGILSFEFSATNAPTWSGNYTLYFIGNPALSWYGGTPPLVQSNSITWYDYGTISDAQAYLSSRIRTIATELENAWVAVDLIEVSSSGTILTPSGEDYFCNSISDLRNFCPELFYQTMQAVEYEHDILITDLLSSGNDTVATVQLNDYYAQQFQPIEAYVITGANIKCYKVGTPATLTLSLRACTAAGLPIGGDLASGTYDTADLTTSTNGTWINISFTSDYALSASTNYSIVARTSAAGVGNRVMWFVDTDNGYSRGQACIYTGGVWTAVTGSDTLFEIQGRDAITMSIGARVEDRLVGTQFDFTNWANAFGLTRIWWSTIFWIGITVVIVIAASFGSNAWDCSVVVFALMVAYGWRGGWVSTVLFALILAMLSGGLVYAIFWKKT